jgi:Tfp pilus assembly major pilin PilA
MIARIIETAEITIPMIETGIEKIQTTFAVSESSPMRKPAIVMNNETTVRITHNHQYDAIKIIFFSFQVQVKAWVASRQVAKRPGLLFARRRSPRPDFQ